MKPGHWTVHPVEDKGPLPGADAGALGFEAVMSAARAKSTTTLKAMTTNDNMPALAFYQKSGFGVSRLHLEAIDHFRSVVPTIARTGHMDIEIHDAIELEIAL